MSIEQSIATLTSASNKLTVEVSNKITDINKHITEADQKVTGFINGARNEFLIPNLPIAIKDNWSATDDLDHGLAMKALPRYVFLKKYDSKNKVYEGDKNFKTHDSYAPSDDLYPSGALQYANYFMGSNSQLYCMFYMHFTSSVFGGGYPTMVIKCELVKLQNDPGVEMGEINSDNHYSNMFARGLCAMGVVKTSLHLFTKADPNHLSATGHWDGITPVYFCKPIFHTTDSRVFQSNSDGLYITLRSAVCYRRHLI